LTLPFKIWPELLGGFWTEEEERLGIGGHCGSNQGRQSEHTSAVMAKGQSATHKQKKKRSFTEDHKTAGATHRGELEKKDSFTIDINSYSKPQ